MFLFLNLLNFIVGLKFPSPPGISKLIGSGGKNAELSINIVVSDLYRAMYQTAHKSLESDLNSVVEKVVSALESSPQFLKSSFGLTIKLVENTDQDILESIDTNVCESSIAAITQVLESINQFDSNNHYIVLLPCPTPAYEQGFSKVKLDVPYVTQSINLQCSKRIGMLFVDSFDNLMSTFGNAIFHLLGAKDSINVSITEKHAGDIGKVLNFDLPDGTVRDILENKCFRELFS